MPTWGMKASACIDIAGYWQRIVKTGDAMKLNEVE
jgi:hypothetical protein